MDAAAMAYRLALWEESRYGIIADVGLVDGPSAARQYGTVILRNRCAANATEAEDVDQQAPAGPRNLAMELPLSDMVSAQLMSAVDKARVGGGRRAVGLGRWCYHLNTIRGVNTKTWMKPRRG